MNSNDQIIDILKRLDEEDSLQIPLEEAIADVEAGNLHKTLEIIVEEYVNRFYQKERQEIKEHMATVNHLINFVKYLGKIGKPAEKLMDFYLKDSKERLDFIESGQLIEILLPGNEEKNKKWRAKRNARHREEKRLFKSYYRYWPTLNQQLDNHIEELKEKLAAVEAQNKAMESEVDSIGSELAKLEAEEQANQ